MNTFFYCSKILSFVLFLFLLGCEGEEAPNSSPLAEDCAGVNGGVNICGCTDSTAYNYDRDATYDDGTCQSYLDQGDYYLGFNGSNSSVNVGDIMPQGSYTKAAWVKRKYGYQAKHNILSLSLIHI